MKMNRNIIDSLLVGAVIAGFASCGENTWNDHSLDGFKGGVDYDKAVSGSYTLTADDYKAISDLMQQRATTDPEKAEAKAIASNCYFNKYGTYPASVALPAYMATASFPYYLASDGSQADVAYEEVSEVPAELNALAAASQYKVTSDDYKSAWGSDENYINAFSPMTSAANKLPGILKKAYPDAEAGNYAVVNYNVSLTNPIFGTVEGGAKFEAGSYFLVADGNIAAAPLAENKTYGYLQAVQVTVDGDAVSTDVANAFVFEEADGGFYIKDSLGRYLYQTGTFDSMNLTKSVPDDGGVWTVSVADNGLATITNVSVGKWLQFDSRYNSWGSYNSERGSLPKLYNAPVVATRATRSVVGTPVTESENAVYYYDGSSWSVADGVSVLNPSDYEAMGVRDNSLSDADVYIPKYLGNKFVYAQSGDTRYVVYNTNKVDLFVYDGTKWTVNNNGLETVVGRFVKKSGEWSFSKYIGKATFSFFNEDELMLDRSYLFVYDNICATPLDKSSNYGYLAVANILVSGETVVLPSDANAFSFVTKAVVDDVEYTVADGKFLIVDSNGRYNYYDGSHASMQLKDAPEIKDGEIAPGFCWSAAHNEDGSWIFESDYGDGNVRWLVYSLSYNNFAIYSTITETDKYPKLYLMDE